jgi:hypothetical protein
MLPAFAARRFGMQNGLILTGVQVPPAALRLMVVQLARRPTFRARPVDHVVMSQVEVNLAALQLQFHRVHKPRGFRFPESVDTVHGPARRHCRMLRARVTHPLRFLNSQSNAKNPVRLLAAYRARATERYQEIAAADPKVAGGLNDWLAISTAPSIDRGDLRYDQRTRRSGCSKAGQQKRC